MVRRHAQRLNLRAGSQSHERPQNREEVDIAREQTMVVLRCFVKMKVGASRRRTANSDDRTRVPAEVVPHEATPAER